jgi:hypothetical protein
LPAAAAPPSEHRDFALAGLIPISSVPDLLPESN